MIVLWYTVLVVIPVMEPPVRPLAQGPIHFTKMGFLNIIRPLHHPGQRPAMNRRFVAVPKLVLVVDKVRNQATLILAVEENHKLVPGQLWVMSDQSHRIEAVIPAATIRHPVLRHIHCWPGQTSFRGNQTGPGNISRQFTAVLPAFGNGQAGTQPLVIFLLHR
ncbi:hypothetical protein D3C78_1022660 [compost metagenome]